MPSIKFKDVVEDYANTFKAASLGAGGFKAAPSDYRRDGLRAEELKERFVHITKRLKK